MTVIENGMIVGIQELRGAEARGRYGLHFVESAA